MIAVFPIAFRPTRPLTLLLALSMCLTLPSCVDSAKPLLGDARPLLGGQLRLQLFALREGAAHDATVVTFQWRNGRYLLKSGKAEGFGDITVHDFAGPDLIVQSMRPGLPTEYAIARKIADGTYLVFAIDESDADQAIRDKLCGAHQGLSCRIETQDAVLALARATAAKAHSTGGLAVLMADQ